MAEQQDRDQKTEDATPQRLRKAREDGQLGFSSELISGAMLMAASVFFWLMGEDFVAGLCGVTKFQLSNLSAPTSYDEDLIPTLIASGTVVGQLCLALILPLAVVAGAFGILQTGFNISFKPLNLDWSKLSVPKGFGRMFSSKGLVRGGLSVAKTVAIVAILGWLAIINGKTLAMASLGSFVELVQLAGSILVQASLWISLMLLVVGVIDFAYQKWKHLQEMKMSVKEIRDEHKDSDGDPLIRARVRRLQAEMSKQRMLSAVPTADVVVTNPTHYAVALRYDRERMEAPVVVAKGADHLAKRIIEAAKENKIALIERKPVARFLYANVEVDQPIPFELYQAVAEILNLVQQLKEHCRAGESTVRIHGLRTYLPGNGTRSAVHAGSAKFEYRTKPRNVHSKVGSWQIGSRPGVQVMLLVSMPQSPRIGKASASTTRSAQTSSGVRRIDSTPAASTDPTYRGAFFPR